VFWSRESVIVSWDESSDWSLSSVGVERGSVFGIDLTLCFLAGPFVRYQACLVLFMLLDSSSDSESWRCFALSGRMVLHESSSSSPSSSSCWEIPMSLSTSDIEPCRLYIWVGSGCCGLFLVGVGALFMCTRSLLFGVSPFCIRGAWSLWKLIISGR
jgi:hypothetical protein